MKTVIPEFFCFVCRRKISGIQNVPAKATAKPDFTHIQTAKVVGAGSQPIYTDEFGRVKVQFHWDLLNKNNEHSSSWLRTSQMISGNKWGSQLIPRVGDEVVVGYFDNDLNKPMVLGGVYNSTNEEIYPLPDKSNQSLKS